MTCIQCQDHLFEVADLNASLEPEVTVHLQGCATCREVRENLSRVDEALTYHTAAQAELPADFKASLMARLPPIPERIMPSQVAHERMEAIRQHHQAVAALERQYLLPHFRVLPRFLTTVGIVVLTVLGLYEAASQLGWDTMLTVGCGTGVLALILALTHTRVLSRLPGASWARRGGI